MNRTEDNEAGLTTDGNTVYYNGCPVAIIKGDRITADQITILRDVVTNPREELMRNLNARMRGNK